MRKPNPYRTLGIKPDASVEEIEQAYKRNARQHHPDRNIGDEKAKVRFEAVQKAYDLLCDPELRELYDRTGAWGEKKPDDAEEKVHNLLLSVFETVMAKLDMMDVDPNKTDLIARMRELLVGASQEGSKEIAQTEKMAAKLRRLIGRFAAKGGGECFLNGVVARKLNAIEARLEASRANLETAEKALKTLADFTYDFDKPKLQQAAPIRDHVRPLGE